MPVRQASFESARSAGVVFLSCPTAIWIDVGLRRDLQVFPAVIVANS